MELTKKRPNWDLEDFLAQKLQLEEIANVEYANKDVYKGIYKGWLKHYDFSSEILRQECGIEGKIEWTIRPWSNDQIYIEIQIFHQ